MITLLNLMIFYFFLGQFNLNNFNIKRIVNKQYNRFLSGGGDGKEKGKINNLEEFIFNKTKFIVRIIHGDATDIKGKTHTIKFVSLDDMNESSIGCATLNFDYDKKTAFIQSIGDYASCVFCPTADLNFKVGQILMMMIITLCNEKKKLIDKIELTDISKFNCFNTYNKKDEYIINSKYKMHDNLDLMIISTLLKGYPYYYKYGFMPKNKEDNLILKHNNKIFEKKIKVKTLNLKNYIKKNLSEIKIINKKDYDKYIEIIDKFIIGKIDEYNNKPVDKFIHAILNTNPDNIDDKIVLCNIIISFYKKIFNDMGYKIFKDKVFIKIL